MLKKQILKNVGRKMGWALLLTALMVAGLFGFGGDRFTPPAEALVAAGPCWVFDGNWRQLSDSEAFNACVKKVGTVSKANGWTFGYSSITKYGIWIAINSKSQAYKASDNGQWDWQYLGHWQSLPPDGQCPGGSDGDIGWSACP